MQEFALPFPRGSTYSDWGAVTMTATYADGLEGRIFETEDTVHNTGRKIKLRVVRNSTGAAITTARNFCEFSVANSLDFGRNISGFGTSVSAQGAVVKPLDDAYTTGRSIPANDLFFVVEAGPCGVLTDANAISLAAGSAVATNAAGRIHATAAAAGEYVVGTLDRSAVVSSQEVIVHVNEGLDNASA